MEVSDKDLELMKKFEDFTGVMPVEVYEEDGILFFSVPFKKIGKAIGKGGKNILKLEKRLGKKLYVFAYSNKLEQFIRNFLNNVKVISLDVENIMGQKGVYVVVDERDKRKLLGKSKTRIKLLKRLVKEKFNAQFLLKTKVLPY